MRLPTLICLSSAPVARYFPSGLKRTLRMYRSPVVPAASSIRTLHEPRQRQKRSARTDIPRLLPGFHIVNLGRAIAPCREILAVGRELDTADDTGPTHTLANLLIVDSDI